VIGIGTMGLLIVGAWVLTAVKTKNDAELGLL
jgi:hypothetical protein